MINTVINPTLFDKLNSMSDTFYLTGSMFFIGQGNDYDFFVQNDGTIIERLRELGFKEISKKTYGDNLCIAVLRAFSGSTQIDIQVVSNALLKDKVQKRLKELEYLQPLQNEWNLAFKLLKD